jgi:hypothetical protein
LFLSAINFLKCLFLKLPQSSAFFCQGKCRQFEFRHCVAWHFIVQHFVVRHFSFRQKNVVTIVARWYIFKPKLPIWVKFGGPWMENVVIFYDHLEYILVIWYKLWPFGIVCGHLVYFLRLGMFWPRKMWQPWGRCYDYNFLRFSTIFGKKMAFFSKTNAMIKVLHNLALFWVKSAKFLLNFSDKIFF